MTSISAVELPASDAYGPWLAEERDALLGRARVFAQRLRAGSTGTPLETLQLWNEVNVALMNATCLGELFTQVHPDAAVRDQAAALEAEARSLTNELGMDRRIYEALTVCTGSRELDAAAARALEHSLRDFRRAGVDRDEPTRQLLHTISEEMTEKGQVFDRNIRDAVGRVRVKSERLSGLPKEFLASHQPVDGVVELTTDFADFTAVMTFAHDRTVRAEMATAYFTRAWPDNDSVLRELLVLRRKKAQLLGYPDWPSYDAETKMIGSGPAIADLIDRVADLAGPSASRDYAVLLDRKRRDLPEATDLNEADRRYYLTLLGKEQFDVDAERVGSYFDFTKVLAGLLDVTGRLFGLTYVPVADQPLWHDEVTAYDVVATGSGAMLGRIYLDLHPREGKYSWFAQFELVKGVNSRQRPEGVLVCNFPRGLMSHFEVTGLFHEFGHLLHQVLGGHQDWVRFSGVATEWDFVEAPSQMLEEWAWDHSVLATFATDDSGEPIPVDLVARMREADAFGRGIQRLFQVYLAAVSYTLHQDVPDDLSATVQQLEERYLPLPHMPGTYLHTWLGHLNEYSSAYYTYTWSLIIAKDLFSAFDLGDLMATDVANRYRDRVLTPGGSRDATDLIADFLGRPYSFDPFEAWLND